MKSYRGTRYSTGMASTMRQTHHGRITRKMANAITMAAMRNGESWWVAESTAMVTTTAAMASPRCDHV